VFEVNIWLKSLNPTPDIAFMKRKCSRRRAVGAVEETAASRRFVPNNPAPGINIYIHMFRPHFGTFRNLLNTLFMVVLNSAVCLSRAVQELSDHNAGMDCRSCAGRVGVSLCGHAADEVSSDARYPAWMAVYFIETQVWWRIRFLGAVREHVANGGSRANQHQVSEPGWLYIRL
jgi:hypothetical protein